MQGQDGYLWLGTEKGLVRFDGREFRLEPGTESVATGAPDVLGLVADPDGGLWLRPDRPALLRYRDGRLENVAFARHEREVAVTAMTLGRTGALLLFAQVSGLLERRADRFEPRPLDRALPSVVLSLAETPEGTLFLGTRDTGLFLAREGRLTAVSVGLPDRKVNCLLAVSDREVWVGTDRGVARWNGAALTRDGVPAALDGRQVLALLRDRDANVWVGTSTGLLRASSQGVAALPSSAEGASPAVTALFEDREGDLWLGHGSGIERLHDTLFAAWTRARGLPSDGGGAIHVDGKGRVWFAPPEGGLVSIDGARVEGAAGLDGDRVYSIAPGRDGLWLGRQRGGLTHVRLDGGALELRSYGEADGLAQAGVYAVHEARDGSVWAGTLNRGLSRLRQGRFETFTTTDGLPSNSVSALLDSRDGTLWVGTPAGLAAWWDGTWTTRRARDGLPSDNVAALLEDSQGVLWIGTSEGLAFLRSGRVGVPPPGAPPPLRESVVGLVESEGGWLWVSTTRRLMRVRREALLTGAPLESGDLVSYGRADGLVGLEGVRRHRSVALDPRGRIWFSTDRGLSVVHPRRALAAHPPPVVHVRSLDADERAIALGASVRVPPRPQRVRIAYTGVSLQSPERVRFRHRLEGVDADWSEPVASEEAVYANLAPGAYRFRVAATGADGLWDGPEAALAFTIAPAAWQTAWFRLAALLALALGAWLVYRWRLGQATRQLNLAFEERLAERTRIARELHDTLLQGFVSASMQLHVAVDHVPQAAPARGPLERVQKLVSQVIEQGRDAVRGLRSADRDAGDLAQALSRLAEERPADDQATLRVIVEGAPRPLHPSVREELYRIGREALVNALRHARAQRIEVELEYARRAVRLLVRDDGIGIDPGVLQSGREGPTASRACASAPSASADACGC